MADVALFHSALGVRPGILDAADRLRTAGHRVLVVDQYDGRSFDDYETASRFVEEIGFPELMRRAVDAVRTLPDGFVAAGFSNGAGIAEFVATQRLCSGVVMVSGALPLAVLGAAVWPTRLPAQIHFTSEDPFRNQQWLDALVAEIRAADAPLEVFEYPGAGHLFTDSSRIDEYDAAAATKLWARVLRFCADLP